MTVAPSMPRVPVPQAIVLLVCASCASHATGEIACTLDRGGLVAQINGATIDDRVDFLRDYALTAEATIGPRRGQARTGIVTLTQDGEPDAPGSQGRLRGWTDVDFRSLGAPIGAGDTPASSQDRNNPGVVVLSPPHGAPILLIGTVENKRATRGARDGGGIGLFVQSADRRCWRGEWREWGIAVAGRGRFELCARVSNTGGTH